MLVQLFPNCTQAHINTYTETFCVNLPLTKTHQLYLYMPEITVLVVAVSISVELSDILLLCQTLSIYNCKCLNITCTVIGVAHAVPLSDSDKHTFIVELQWKETYRIMTCQQLTKIKEIVNRGDSIIM